ncbi:MptD family putative ECF transporter S component [Pseudoramibacter faecis]|uniref:MptD family putative ECF transporter S component n=1 Tax=Pseudoramibacter faecis TaxID=3108534 RepID=UPI002E78D026|nr:MptD family putative ECF transporter S component [Pseudoramibacter sp. HA2172]
MKKNENRLQTRDYISIGVFSLIYFVIAFVIGGIAQMTPVTFPFMPMIVALFAGSVFMLYTAKIPKRGSLSILGILAGILLFVTGMFWMMSAFFIVFGFIADYICSTGNFKSFRRNLLAYCIFALSPMGAYIPMAIMPAQFDAFMRKKGNVSSFEGIIHAIRVNWWIIPLMISGTILCAVIGGLIGKKLLKKHFEKVGII